MSIVLIVLASVSALLSVWCITRKASCWNVVQALLYAFCAVAFMVGAFKL